VALLGGSGVVEDFSCVPRLLRDSVVNEVWEGPRNVLLAQVHRDLAGAAGWYPAAELAARLLGPGAAGARELGAELAALVARGDLSAGDGAVEACRRWDAACRALLHGFQAGALGRADG
jgi:hypothetical protein